MKLFITKDFDGIGKAFYGKKPTFEENDGNGFWEIPLSEWDESCGYDIITVTGAYYYSSVLTKMLKMLLSDRNGMMSLLKLNSIASLGFKC